jgi:hypothetical protein
MEEADAECEWRGARPFGVLRLETELEAEASRGEEVVKICGEGGLEDSSCPTHQSQRTQPRKVAMEPQPTIATGETRSWTMPTKQTTKIMTEQTCWTMTVESATRGQKS